MRKTVKKRLQSVCSAAVAFLISGVIGLSLWNESTFSARAEQEQIHNTRVQSITAPNENQYNENWDWKATAENYLRYVFDTRNDYEADNGDHGGYMSATRSRKIGRFVSSKNMDEYFGDDEGTNQAWGMASYIGYNMNDMELGEGITNLAAIASAALIGLENLNDYQLYNEDGTPLARYNFVKSAVAHYNRYDHIVSNGDDWSGRSGQDEFWYELLPNVLFTIIANEYADIEYVEENGEKVYYLRDIVTESARNRLTAVIGMGGVNADFDHKSFDITLGKPVENSAQRNADSAAGFAYVLYSAYAMNMALPEEERLATEAELEQFRLGAIWSMDYLQRIDFNPFYEVLVYLAPYLAARLNAEQGTNYNVAKMYNWAFSDSQVRGGWGMINDNWNGFYTQGLMGSTQDGGGYAFAMNTFDAVMGFVPMVRYDVRFAEDIARWITCASQSAQNFYPQGLDYSDDQQINGSVYSGEIGGYYDNDVYNGFYQSGKWIQMDTEPEYWTGEDDAKMASFIPYEGLRRYRKKVVYNGHNSNTRASQTDTNYGPYASGDAYTYNWNGHTDYGMYGAAHVGIFASVIEKTNVSRILEIDLNKLDVFGSNVTDSGKEIAFKMYYNPYGSTQTVTVTCADGASLFDTLTKKTVATSSGTGKVSVTMKAGQTMVLAKIPQGETVSNAGGSYTCGGVFLAQEKGSATLEVYAQASGGEKISSGSTVKGTIYAQLGATAPASGTVKSAELSFAGSVIAKYDMMPSNRIEIDTTLLKNTMGNLRLTVDFGGSKESVDLSITVDNRTPTYDIINYEDDTDMAAKWTVASTEWNALYPESEHYGTVKASSDGVTISLPTSLSAGRDYAWVTSELFTVDFARQPVLKFTVGEVSAKYSVKIFIEGIEKKSDAYTGKYLIANSSSAAGELTYNLPDDLPKEIVNDPNFDSTGVYRISLKISAVGGVGDSVQISDFEVYHGTKMPTPSEPNEYEWGYEFSAAHIYNWDASIFGETTVSYLDGITQLAITQNGGVAGPFMTAVNAKNPSVEIRPMSVVGSYFVGLILEGYGDHIYYLKRNIRDVEAVNISVKEMMEKEYPGTLEQGVRLRLIVGAEENSVLKLGKVRTYYALPEWGTVLSGAEISEWADLAGAAVSVSLDIGGRAVIVNGAECENETVIAGKRGSFDLNMDRNPFIEIIVREATGAWRLTLTSVLGGKTYELIGWNTEYGRDARIVSLADKLNELQGKQSVYLTLEIQGGGNSLTVQTISAYYKTVMPTFGNTYSVGAATWIPNTNAPDVSIEDNGVRVQVKGTGNKGLLTPMMMVLADETPMVTLSLLDVDETDGVYVYALIGGVSYSLTGMGIYQSGEILLDIRALTGFDKARAFTMQLVIGGSEDDFSFVLESITFAYKLEKLTSLQVADDTISWLAAKHADSYQYQITDGNGTVVKSGTTVLDAIPLSRLKLEEGIYTASISAMADGYIPSEAVKVSFKIGEIETVTLGKTDVALNGFEVVWTEVANAMAYEYTLKDADDDTTIATGTTTELALDISKYGLPAFNYEIQVKALGDGVVFADGETASLTFHTADIARYTASSFPAMIRGQNNALATYEAEIGASAITVPGNGNWGNVQTAVFTLNFDKQPVLVVRFGENNVGGYHLSIIIDGTTYNLCDDTYDYGDGTLYMDINAALESRNGPPYYDGPGAAITGEHKVQILFGVTMGENSGTPKVYYKSANVYEMTEGKGTKMLGQLAAAEISIAGGKVTWGAVEHAQSYLISISNEFGVLLSETVDRTSYDLSFLVREGDYSVQIIAQGDGYYESAASVRLFRVSKEMVGGDSSADTEKEGCAGSVENVGALALLTLVAGLAMVTASKREER